MNTREFMLFFPRQAGKTLAAQQMVADHIKANPEATIITARPGKAAIFERYIGSNKHEKS